MRAEIRNRLTSISKEERTRSALAACRLFDFSLATKKNVAAFLPLPHEFDIVPLLTEIENRGSTLHFPRCEPDQSLVFQRATIADSRSWMRNTFGVLEPPITHAPVIDFDLLIVPALIVHPQTGARMGYGKGYYDRTIPKMKVSYRVSLVYDFQVREDWKPNSWDICVNRIVTPTKSLEIISNE